MRVLKRSSLLVGGGAQAPGHVVLRDHGEGYTGGCRYVVHFHNTQDGGYHNGNYSDDYDKALEYYVERCQRYGVTP